MDTGTALCPRALPPTLFRRLSSAPGATRILQGLHRQRAHTRRAYARIVDRFLLWCDKRGLELVNITPGLAGEFINARSRP